MNPEIERLRRLALEQYEPRPTVAAELEKAAAILQAAEILAKALQSGFQVNVR